MKAPVRVTVTGAAGQIGYALLFRIASGAMLGDDQPCNKDVVIRSCFSCQNVCLAMSDPTKEHAAVANVLECIPDQLYSHMFLRRERIGGGVEVKRGENHNSPD